MKHSDARRIVVEAFRQEMMREPSRAEAQFAHAVSQYETGCGTWWKGAGVGSNNWGAVQFSKPPCPVDRSFLYTDTHPNDDGTSTRYEICFRREASPVDGARRVIREIYKRRPDALAAASAGDVHAFSEAMYDSRYYEGFGPTRKSRIDRHASLMRKWLNVIASALGEPLPDGGTPPPATIKRGARGPAVKTLQNELGLVADGVFGPHTETAVKAFQKVHGLKPDGVVGPATWARLLEQDP